MQLALSIDALVMIARLKRWADRVKRDILALYLAMRDPRVPWFAKFFAAVVAGYALSPIDLIPDFIPIVGYLDDLVLLPLGIVLAIRMIPPPVMEDLRHRAAAHIAAKPPASFLVVSA